MGGPTLGIFGQTAPQVILPGGEVIDRIVADRLQGACDFFSRMEYRRYFSPKTTGAQKNLSIDSDVVPSGAFWWVLLAAMTMELIAAYPCSIYLMPPNALRVTPGLSYGNFPPDLGIALDGQSIHSSTSVTRSVISRPVIVPPRWYLRAQTDNAAGGANVSIGDSIRLHLAVVEFNLSELNPCL